MKLRMENKLDLIYKLDGQFEEGVDVFEISPILLHLGELIQESNKILFPDGKEVSVNVRPFEKGSFLVDILIFSSTHLEQLKAYVNQDSVKQIKELLEWIGLVKGLLIGGGALSLLALILKLRGKPKSVEKTGPDEYRYTSNEGNSITVKSPVHNLFQNPTIQTAVFNTYGKPFENEQIKGIRTYTKEAEKGFDEVVVTNEEGKYFQQFEKPEIIDESEMVNKNDVKLFLNPKRGSYEGGKGPYSFTVSGDKDNTISPVEIADEEFLAKLVKGETRLHYTDLIEAELTFEQKVKDNEVVSTRYQLTKVVSYKKAPKQQSLIDTDEPTEE